MFSSFLLESTVSETQLLKAFNLIKSASNSHNKTGRALLLTLSVIILFVLGIYSGLYGAKAFGYRSFVKDSKTWLGGFLKDLTGMSKKQAEKMFNTVNALSIIVLVFIIIQIIGLSHISKNQSNFSTDFNLVKEYYTNQHLIDHVFDLAQKSNKYSDNIFIRASIFGFLVVHKTFAAGERIVDFLHKIIEVIASKKFVGSVFVSVLAVSLLATFLYVLAPKFKQQLT